MNTKKGKGKRSNKPTNPNPSQKEEKIDVEKVENVLEIVESAQKSEERVPEIISETVTQPVLESKDKEEDNPKKPKRNRGKKKKQEKDENDVQDGQLSENVEDVPLEIIKIETQEVAEEENVTPSARKKKNKNKKVAETEIKETEPSMTNIAFPENKPEVGNMAKEEPKSDDGGDTEIKAPKKKNKKKKQRSDSEKSDVKAEDISCVSAFQNLLKDDKNASDIEVISKNVIISKETNIGNLIQSDKVEDVKDIPQDTKKGLGNETSGKGKKKNKKDKIEPPKEIESDFGPNISLVTAIKPASKEDITLFNEELMFKDDQVIELSPEDITKTEGNVKQKAKIAKPVERKRKDKGDKQEEIAPENIIFKSETKIKETLTESTDQNVEMPQQDELMTLDQPIAESKQNVLVEKKKKGKTNKQSEEMIKKCESRESQIKEPKKSDSKAFSILEDDAMSGLAEMTFEEEPILPEPPNIDESNAGIVKPAEKKEKGKNKSQSQEVTKITESKGTEIKEQKMQETILASVDTRSPTETKADVDFTCQTEIKTDTSILLKTAVAVKEKDEQESVKPAERKRKNKKGTKSQELETSEDKEFKDKELVTPEPVHLCLFGSPMAAKEEIINIKSIPIIPKEVENVESTQIDNKPHETKRKSKKEKHIKESTEIISQEQMKIKEEIIAEPIADIAVEEVNIGNQGKILKDFPLMLDPIENIQTKQEASGVIELGPLIPETKELKETSFINPPESEMGKKRKKSPKPIKQEQKHKIPEVKAEILTEPAVPIMNENVTFEEKPMKEEECKIRVANVPILLDELQIQQEETKPADISKSITPMDVFQEMEDKTPFETKSKKKRKKSPRLPDKEVATNITEPILIIEAEKVVDVKTEEGKHEEESFSKFPTLDVEIRSLKAEDSEDSAFGFTPDIIQHPRATSQDLIDNNNNNMLIQEITLVEEARLQIPTTIPDTPLIQGSGSTPLETPGNILVGIKISQVDTPKTEPEKTDLKSKMMEVNQDMEELRLSIERSLAELTAIEKSEGEVEKLFEVKTNVTEGIKPSECKISMPTEIIAKTHGEKTEKKSEIILSPPPIDNNPVDTIIPPKTSMFFDKELKITEAELKPASIQEYTSPADISKPSETAESIAMPPVPPARKSKSSSKERENKDTKIKPADDKPKEVISTETPKQTETLSDTTSTPVCPARKDHKNKGKNKKKGKQDAAQATAQTDSTLMMTTESNDPSKETKKEEETTQKPQSAQEKSKQQSDTTEETDKTPVNQESESTNVVPEFEPIENFEDAMTSSADDINKTFEMIANEASRTIQASHVNPEIKIVAPVEDTKERRDEKINPVSQPKNLLGHPDIPVRLNKTDYKKEKNKSPNAILAKVKIKDSVAIEENKQSKDTQTENIRKFMKSKSNDESFSSVTNENDEFIYKYSFRKVFLQSACHVCKKELKQARVPCSYCNLVFYCSAKHKDEDYPQHQGLCFAVSTIVHLKDQKHIYADAKNVKGQDYRLLRMQMIVSCERVLKRKLSPWEQEALLYPRICADVGCREWRQSKLQDCDGCRQISYCSSNPNHFPKSHQRWCKSYALYQKLVCHQQTQGRVEPKLPGKVMVEPYQIPDKINEALATMFEEKIDMNDIQYAALTQIATAPLTAAYCHQVYTTTKQPNGTYKKPSCTVHIVGGELQFEADALNKWEVFFLHLRPHLQDLRVVMVGADLNPSNLPLELLRKVKLCESCRLRKRRLVFSFHDNTTYHDYRASEEFLTPDIVCAFNPSIKRSSMYNGKDQWPKIINSILKQKVPFLITSHSLNEIQRDLTRVKDVSEMDLKLIIDPKLNSFASARPDRNFISDDETPLLFNNYSYGVLCGV